MDNHRRRFTTLWGPRKWQDPKGRRAKLEVPRGVGTFKGCSPSHQLGVWGSAVSSPSGVRGEVPVIWRFRTLYRLTKPLPICI